MVHFTIQKVKHTELGDWTISGSHTIFLPEGASSHAYLLANPVLNFVVKIIIVTKIQRIDIYTET